jgi:GNAT superfamily N-acetyltransferase
MSTEIELTQLVPAETDWQQVLDLVLASFSYMNGVIDPPSSALRLTVENLKQKAQVETAFGAFEDARLVGCIFCDPRSDCLYVGKLAIDPAMQGRGIGSLLLQEAERLAREMGLGELELQTRVELARNHAYFARHGFVKTGEGAHAGYDRPTSITMRKQVA